MADVIPSAGTRIGIGLSTRLRVLDFRGRSTRTEVHFFVVTMLPGLFLAFVLSLFGAFDLSNALRGIVPDRMPRAQLSAALSYLPFLPLFVLAAWRLHDIGLPGWPGLFFVLTGALLAIWNEAYSRMGEPISPLSGSVQLLRAACLFAVYAALLWGPQRRSSSYDRDTRRGREPSGDIPS